MAFPHVDALRCHMLVHTAFFQLTMQDAPIKILEGLMAFPHVDALRCYIKRPSTVLKLFILDLLRIYTLQDSLQNLQDRFSHLCGLSSTTPGPRLNLCGLSSTSPGPRLNLCGLSSTTPGSRLNLCGLSSTTPGSRLNLCGLSSTSPGPRLNLCGLSSTSPGPKTQLTMALSTTCLLGSKTVCVPQNTPLTTLGELLADLGRLGHTEAVRLHQGVLQNGAVVKTLDFFPSTSKITLTPLPAGSPDNTTVVELMKIDSGVFLWS